VSSEDWEKGERLKTGMEKAVISGPPGSTALKTVTTLMEITLCATFVNCLR